MTETRLHSVALTAHALGVSEWTVFALIRRGALRSVKIGTRRLIPESALQDYIANLGDDSEPERTGANVPA